MSAGLGGSGAMYIVPEAVYGTYIDPTGGTGIWVPFLDESLEYNENKYYSQQIRNQFLDSDVKQSFYHVEGDIRMEVDCAYLPYFLKASRLSVSKTGTGPWTYTCTPGTNGSAYPGGAQIGLSITIFRNGVGFGYGGCVVSQAAYTITDGVAEVTFSMLGLSEATPGGAGSQSFAAANIFGADAHTIYTDASGTAPSFASADATFNGFTFTLNDNATPQNRITPVRSATYVAFGKSEYSYATELDFIDKTEYANFVGATTKAIRYQSVKPGGAGTYAAATDALRITARRSAYDTYSVNNPGIGDIVMAQVNGHGLIQVGAAAYTIECKSSVTNLS